MFPLFVWNLLARALLYTMLLVSSSLLSSNSAPFLAHWLDPSHSHATKIVSLLFYASISKEERGNQKPVYLTDQRRLVQQLPVARRRNSRSEKAALIGLNPERTQGIQEPGCWRREVMQQIPVARRKRETAALIGLDPGKQGSQEPGCWREGSNERWGTATARRSQQPTERPVLLFLTTDPRGAWIKKLKWTKAIC